MLKVTFWLPSPESTDDGFVCWRNWSKISFCCWPNKLLIFPVFFLRISCEKQAETSKKSSIPSLAILVHVLWRPVAYKPLGQTTCFFNVRGQHYHWQCPNLTAADIFSRPKNRKIEKTLFFQRASGTLWPFSAPI